jgi:flagellar protein FliO/FliZ
LVCLIPLAAAQAGDGAGAAGESDTAAGSETPAGGQAGDSAASGGGAASADGAGEPAAEGNAGVDETTLTFAEDDGESATPEGQPGAINSLGVWDFVRMVLVLGIVIAAIYLVFYLLKRASGGRFENSPMIRLLGSHALPGNKALHLVEVGRQVFLIGVGDEGISLISEISDQESLDELRLKASTAPSERKSNFADLLSGFFQSATGSRAQSGNDNGERGSGPVGGGAQQAPASFFESQKERLRKLR